MKAYTIHYEQQLGRGAYGQVFLATHKTTGEELVAKVLLKKKLSTDCIGSIESEVAALKELNHENIVKLHDFIEDRCAYYLFLEKVSGGELFERIAHKTKYTEAEARDVCKEILVGLQHCHNSDIVHRDLKPENLLLLSKDDNSKIKIVDFGFACRCTEPNLEGSLGTPIFMAPELWKNESYGKPVDMWAFGVIVFSLISGQLPFPGKSVGEISGAIKSGRFEFEPGIVWDEVTTEAKDFICKLLCLDPLARMTATQALNHDWVGPALFNPIVIIMYRST
jgi:calcium/calmodulin-dependent protein kinase I